MKIFKKFLMMSLFALLSVCLISSVPSKKQASAAVLNETVFDYVSISKHGQTLTLENFKTINDTTYIITNNSLTINLKPLEINYSIAVETLNNPNFVPQVTDINLILDEETEQYPDNFVIGESTYYYRINDLTNDLSIYLESPSAKPSVTPIVSTSGSYGSNVIYFQDNADTKVRTIYIVNSYTLISNATNTTFSFRVRTGNVSSRSYDLNFLKPVVQFANAENPIVNFTCNGLDAGNSAYSDTTIRREQSYNSVSIDFLNNDYTEENPLYFKINYNGFTYDFEFYSKMYNEENLLFVNYLDNVRDANNKFLATGLVKDSSDQYVLDTTDKVYAYMNENQLNQFTLEFSKTGRYEIEIYDSTYVYGVENANYYSTSFYIRDVNKSAFDNIYIIAQTQDDQANDIEYIVSTSTLNHNVKATIKNLTNLGTDAGGQPIKLENVLEKIVVTKTIFVGGENVHTYETYTPADILKLVVNGDLTFTYSEDAIYQIEIFKKDNPNAYKYYEFTIVKLTKVTFSVPILNEDGEATKDANGKTLLRNDSASTAYLTDVHNYEMNILSTMDLSIKFSVSVSTFDETLKKTYVNKYSISYGVEQVSIEEYEPVVEEGEEVVDALDIVCYGVGDLTITVHCNGKETVYTLNSEKKKNTLSFTEYGTYTIKIVDSMGTTETYVFEFEKKLNMSAIILIVLSSIIVLVVVLFILKARSKLATR